MGQLAVGPGAPAFAEAIEALFQRDLPVLAAQARARAVTRHGWRGVFERLCDIYARVSDDAGFDRPAEAARR